MNAGYAQTNTGHADGYEIDKNGAWSVNGVTQVKAVPTAVAENDPEALNPTRENSGKTRNQRSNNRKPLSLTFVKPSGLFPPKRIGGGAGN